MENLLKAGSNEAKAMLQLVDKLEAVECVLHGTAYRPVHATVRLMKRLSQASSYPATVDQVVVKQLVSELRQQSRTVARPASDRMVDAASMLGQLLAVAEAS